MSGIEIRSGGIVEVDTEALRSVARALRAMAEELDQLRAGVARAADLAAAAGPAGLPAAYAATLLHSRVEQAERDARDIAERVADAAGLYEAVELQVARDAAAAAGDERRAQAFAESLARMAVTDPAAVLAARALLLGRDTGGGELTRQAWAAGMPFGPSVLWLAVPALLGAADAWGRGRVPAGARLEGAQHPVGIQATGASPVRPPASLSQAAARIPSADARVRVERYDGPAGARQFAVYVAGTRSGGSAEPFDMTSNLQLYAGERSASFAAVTAALRDAGARPGDVVHGFGHSQGAMVLERLAIEERFEMRTLVSFGSPVQADVGPETLAVSVRHTDDPIAGLQAGGHPATVGAEGSFVVERVADPLPGLHDLELPAHQMMGYAETAALIDASTDPRVDGLREALRSIEGTGEGAEYLAARVSPDGGGAAG